jgi:hypothetical protein
MRTPLMVSMMSAAALTGCNGELAIGGEPDLDSGPPAADVSAPPAADAGDVSAAACAPADPACVQTESEGCWASAVGPPEAAPVSQRAAACRFSASMPAASLGDIVGRWVTCSGNLFGTAQNGIEIAGNGRWRLLSVQGSNIVPSTSAGEVGTTYPMLLGSPGAFDLSADTGLKGEYPQGVFVSIVASVDTTGDRLEFHSTSFFNALARIAPSAMNGGDIVPELTGPCSMVGTWSFTTLASSGIPGPSGTIFFNALGEYVVGPQGSDRCTTVVEHGLYATDATTLWSLFVVGQPLLGLGGSLPNGCGPSQYTASWAGGCSSFTVSVEGGNADNCMGNGPFGLGVVQLTPVP